jgi:hypothetical protein
VGLLDSLHLRRRKPSSGVLLEDEPRVNPVAFSIHSYKDRTRGKLAEGMVERRAQQLHAADSYAPWSSLSEVDKELWCHMARMELMGGGPLPPPGGGHGTPAG